MGKYPKSQMKSNPNGQKPTDIHVDALKNASPVIRESRFVQYGIRGFRPHGAQLGIAPTWTSERIEVKERHRAIMGICLEDWVPVEEDLPQRDRQDYRRSVVVNVRLQNGEISTGYIKEDLKKWTVKKIKQFRIEKEENPVIAWQSILA